MEPLVSCEVGAAFPIALCILFAGLAALGYGWSMLADAMLWRRFCCACGNRAVAFRTIELLEAEQRTRAGVPHQDVQ